MWKVRNAQTSTEIQRPERATDPSCDTLRQTQPVPVLVDEDRSIQNLSSCEKVDSAKIQLWFGENGIHHLIQNLLIHAERRRAAAHAHRSTFRLSRWINPNRHGCAATLTSANGGDTSGLRERLHVTLAY